MSFGFVTYDVSAILLRAMQNRKWTSGFWSSHISWKVTFFPNHKRTPADWQESFHLLSSIALYKGNQGNLWLNNSPGSIGCEIGLCAASVHHDELILPKNAWFPPILTRSTNSIFDYCCLDRPADPHSEENGIVV